MFGSFVNFSDLDRTFAALDVMRRQLDRNAFDRRAFERDRTDRTEPRFDIRDDGDAFILRAELPGIPAKNLELTLTGQVLKLRAARNVDVPEGFVAHRRERTPFDLTRSISLPTRIDAERVTAEAKDGIVVVTLPKAAEAKPRNITVKAT
jgi:HSP20 family protein